MVQWLRVLVAFAEDQIQSPGPIYSDLQTSVTLVPGDLTQFLPFLGIRNDCGTHIQADKTFIH